MVKKPNPQCENEPRFRQDSPKPSTAATTTFIFVVRYAVICYGMDTHLIVRIFIHTYKLWISEVHTSFSFPSFDAPLASMKSAAASSGLAPSAFFARYNSWASVVLPCPPAWATHIIVGTDITQPLSSLGLGHSPNSEHICRSGSNASASQFDVRILQRSAG